MDEQRSGEDRRTMPRETERRKRGRPSKGVPVAQSWVSTKLLEGDHDRLIRLAASRRASVAEVMRLAIRALLARHAA